MKPVETDSAAVPTLPAAGKVLLVIPAYNEAKNLPTVISECRQICPTWDTVVVDDGSSDNTTAVAEAMGVRVLRLAINLGIGGAVQTGLLYGLRNGYDVVAQIDGDGQHQVQETARCIEALQAAGADAVVGSRFLENRGGFQSTFQRRLGIRILRWVISLFGGQRVTDPTSGQRALGRRALEVLAASYPQEYPEPEALFVLLRQGLRVIEIPVHMRGRGHGTSSIRAFDSILYMIKVLLAICVHASHRGRRAPA